MAIGRPQDDWWRVATAPFFYDNSGYAFVALFSIAIFGWLIERRHGPVAVALLFAAGGAGGMAVTPWRRRSRSRSAPTARRLRSSSPGRSRTCATCGAGTRSKATCWRRDRRDRPPALPLAVVVDTAAALAGATGVAAGLVLGYPLARLTAR